MKDSHLKKASSMLMVFMLLLCIIQTADCINSNEDNIAQVIRSIHIPMPQYDEGEYYFSGEPEEMTDGIAELGNGAKIDFYSEPAWIGFEFDRIYSVNTVKLWRPWNDDMMYYDTIIQFALDEEFTQGLVTVYNSDKTNTCGQGKGTDEDYIETDKGLTVEFDSIDAKFARIWSSDVNIVFKRLWINEFQTLTTYEAENDVNENPVTAEAENDVNENPVTADTDLIYYTAAFLLAALFLIFSIFQLRILKKRTVIPGN